MRALHKKKSVKAIVISGVSLLLAAAIVVGVLWYLGHRSDPGFPWMSCWQDCV